MQYDDTTIQIYSTFEGNTRHVGEVKGGTFYKRVSRSKHFLKKPLAIANSDDALAQVRAAGASTFHVTDTDSGYVYTVSAEDFYRLAVPTDRNFGPQHFLPLSYWQTDAPQYTPGTKFPIIDALRAAGQKPRRNAVVTSNQLPLFDEVTK